VSEHARKIPSVRGAADGEVLPVAMKVPTFLALSPLPELFDRLCPQVDRLQGPPGTKAVANSVIQFGFFSALGTRFPSSTSLSNISSQMREKPLNRTASRNDGSAFISFEKRSNSSSALSLQLANDSVNGRACSVLVQCWHWDANASRLSGARPFRSMFTGSRRGPEPAPRCRYRLSRLACEASRGRLRFRRDRRWRFIAARLG
jgi:hypothetical protein